MNYILRAFLSIICLFAYNESSASHMMGGDITYKWLGAKKYTITFRVYRDCRGIPFNSPSAALIDNSGGNAKSLNLTRISIEDVTPKCYDSVKGPCNPANTTVSEGVELHTFTTTVDFAASPYKSFMDNNICEVYIYLEQCCRNGAITTISPGNFYVESMMNICNSNFKNSSPQFPSNGYLSTLCNLPFAFTLGAYDYIDFDSLKFELEAPLNAHNSYETYNGNFTKNIPMTPYCPPNPGVINCKPVINVNPPRGFYFNPLNGDMLLTPSKCDEVAVLCVKISEYRKDSSGVWRNLGFVKKDIQIYVKNSQPKNYVHTNDIKNSYKFIYGKNKCIDITTFDTIVSGYSNSNKGDVTSIKLFDMPAGMTFNYTDSSAKNKTGRLCWKVHDSIYNKAQGQYSNKNIPVTVEIRDNFCSTPYVVRKTINIQITPSDSFGRLTVKTYDDKNRNHLPDVGDTLIPALFKIISKSSKKYKQTDNKGSFSDSFWKGNYTIGLLPHPYYEYISKDTNFRMEKDSSYILNLLIERSPGIYGRIFQDANSNCKFDPGEKTLQGYKVHTDSNKYTGISDQNGLYYIRAPKGQYNLRCQDLSAKYSVDCPGSKTINITIDGKSSFFNNDFGVLPKSNFPDLSVGLTVKGLGINVNNNWISFYCLNKGSITRKNIQLKCPLPANVPLYLNGVLVANNGTTATIQIDSLKPGQLFSKVYDVRVSSAYFKTNDKITFTCYTDSLSTIADSVISNNTATEYRIVNGPASFNEKRISIDSIFNITDELISYTIHFQNQGTDTVTRVIVTDTLDAQRLDVSKFVLNWSDYPCETIISDNVITFIFNNLRLPQTGTTNRAGFNFTLGLRKVYNDSGFHNKATIFMDFQEPFTSSRATARTLSPIILQNILKPVMCRYEKNEVDYLTTVDLGSGNRMILELSDTSGSFSSSTVLKTINTQLKNGTIDFVFPKILPSGHYRLRLRSTNPSYTGFQNVGYIDFMVTNSPLFTINTNLKNNKICDLDTFKVTCNDTGFYYKMIKNNVSIGNFSLLRTYNIQIHSGNTFKIISMDAKTLCSDTLAIDPLVMPVPSVTIINKSSKQDFCLNDVITLKGNGAKFYQFLRNDTIIQASSLNDTASILLQYTSKYRVFGISSDGCTNLSGTLNIIVNALPAPYNVTSMPADNCIGDSFYLNYYGNPDYYYTTLRNDSVISKKTDKVVIRTTSYSILDKFTVIAFNSKGCTLNNSNIGLTIHPFPTKPVITKSGNTLIVSSIGISTFKWYRNGVLLSNTGNSILNAPSGTYSIVVSNTWACKSESDDFIHFNTGISDAFMTTIQVYPNPANTSIILENPGNVNYLVNIYELSGKLVLNTQVEHEKSEIDIRQLSCGIYILKATDTVGAEQILLLSVNR